MSVLALRVVQFAAVAMEWMRAPGWLLTLRHDFAPPCCSFPISNCRRPVCFAAGRKPYESIGFYGRRRCRWFRRDRRHCPFCFTTKLNLYRAIGFLVAVVILDVIENKLNRIIVEIAINIFHEFVKDLFSNN